MSRLFAFGCSFTNYRWMTWADILGTQFDEYQNWGQAGAGNRYIYNAVMEADQRHKFESGDTVVVCWSNILREDRYVDGRGWITLGNIGHSPIFTKEFIADSVCERGYLLESLGYVKGVRDFLAYKNVRWKMLSIVPIDQPDTVDNRKLQYGDITDMYWDVIDSIEPAFTDVLGHAFWEKDKHKRHHYSEHSVDYHPTTEEALQYLDTVLPGWVTNEALRQQISQTPLIMNKRANGSCMQKRF